MLDIKYKCLSFGHFRVEGRNMCMGQCNVIYIFLGSSPVIWNITIRLPTIHLYINVSCAMVIGNGPSTYLVMISFPVRGHHKYITCNKGVTIIHLVMKTPSHSHYLWSYMTGEISGKCGDNVRGGGGWSLWQPTHRIHLFFMVGYTGQ